jgi:RNA polymerase sigma factor (sigma-70 family)
MSDAPLAAVLRHLRTLAAVERFRDRTDGELLDAFAAANDQDAFAALVKRHGPLVLAICRRTLRHLQDAEDTFQATFLLLAQKAGSIRKPASLAGWLHGVACRMAQNAKRSAAARRGHEEKAPLAQPADPAREAAWREVQAILDEEIQRLPQRYRNPFILCVLEGQSPTETARRLGVKEGTVTSWLSRARGLLRKRLAKRGVELSLALAALTVSSAPAAVVSGSLVAKTVEAALLYATQGVTATASVAVLLKGVNQAMLVGKLKMAVFVVLTTAIVGTGLRGLAHRATLAQATDQPVPSAPIAQPDAKHEPARSAVTTPATKEETAVISGRVLDPDGKPAAGAKLYLTLSVFYLARPAPSPVYATTGVDGRFQITVLRAQFRTHDTVIVATAKGFGPGWVEVNTQEKNEGLSIRLVRDNVPITGRIVDLQGRPVPGATIRALHVRASPQDDLGPWIDAVTHKKGTSYQLERHYLPRALMSPEVPELPQKVTTDTDGYFRLSGLGGERLVTVRLDGPTIASQKLSILTRPGQTLQLPAYDAIPEFGTQGLTTTYYPASFRHAAAPTRPVIGVVRDKDSRKPLVGVMVQTFQLANDPTFSGREFIQTATDADGRYRLVGMPKGKGNKILVAPTDNQPYLVAAAEVADTAGFDPVTVDFELKRAIWIEGKLTDKATGKPLRGDVYYFARIGNQHVRDYAGYDPLNNLLTWNVREDGTFRVAGLPGPGFLAVQSGDHYLLGRERDDADGTKDRITKTTPVQVGTEAYNALAPIEPPNRVEVFRRDVALDPGQTLTGTVVGPDGKPLTGARTYGLTTWSNWWRRPPLETPAFTVRAFNPRRPRAVLFLHPEKRLVGVLEPPKDPAAPVRVRLGPGATVLGRLVDADGRPRASVELSLDIRLRQRNLWAEYLSGEVLRVEYYPGRIKTDENGRFRLDALLPGEQFNLSDGRATLSFGGTDWFGDGLRAGETKDLGDVQIK